jgi:hypothetical protein
VGIGIGEEPIKLEAVFLVHDTAIERLELVALEWPRLVDVVVEKLDDDPMLLDVGDTEPIVRQRCDQRGSIGEFIQFVEERVPADAEWHISAMAG